MFLFSIISFDESQTLISEVNSVGTIETKTNQLLIVFITDYDTSYSGFKGTLTAVKSESQEVTFLQSSITTNHES